MTWKEFVYRLVCDYCNDKGSRTFNLEEFYTANKTAVENFRKETNQHPAPKVRQQLQFLRDDGLITFLDKRGTYTLRGVDILKDELPDEKIVEVVRAQPPERKEYLLETFARNRGWVREAKEKFGTCCMFHNCENSFKKEDGTRYIEVHHIIPLFQGGEDAVENLGSDMRSSPQNGALRQSGNPQGCKALSSRKK